MAQTFREELKIATRDALLNKTAAEDRVFTMRSLPRRSPQTPNILIFTTDERAQGYGPHGPPSFRRVLTLSVEADIQANTDAELDTAVDQMIADVETALLRNPEWATRHEDVEGIRTVVEHGSLDADTRHAGVTMQFDIAHRTVHEPLIEDDLETVEVDVEPEGADEDAAFDPGVTFEFETSEDE